jgi:hypothetical protein
MGTQGAAKNLKTVAGILTACTGQKTTNKGARDRLWWGRESPWRGRSRGDCSTGAPEALVLGIDVFEQREFGAGQKRGDLDFSWGSCHGRTL